MTSNITLTGILWLILWAAVIGIIIGALARLLVPGTAGFGILKTIVVGFFGAFAGGAIGTFLNWSGWAVVAVQVLIAALLVALLRRPKSY